MDYKKLNNYLNSYNFLKNAGTQDAYNISIDNLVCPCCGKKLKLIDSLKKEYDNNDLIKVNESVLNENKLAD